MFISRSILTGILLSALHVSSAEHNAGEQAEDVLLLEDDVYWGRALRKLQMSVTPAPTPSPTLAGKIDLEIFCTTKEDDDIDCDDIPTPAYQCSNNPESVSFTFIGGRCDMDTQSSGTCDDSNGGPPTRGESVIKCEDDNGGRTLFEDTVSVGSEFSVEGRNGKLPETLSCTVTDEDGKELQTVTMKTGGREDLYLKDKFGSLQVEACDDQDCTVDIVYDYVVTNSGPIDLTVTSLEIDRAGESEDLIDEIDDTKLSPGESTTVSENDVVDVCVDGDYLTTGVSLGSAAGGGSDISDEDVYTFEISGSSSRPTPSPTPGATPRPTEAAQTPPPTNGPTREPTPQPTGSSGIKIDLTCTEDDGTGNGGDDCGDIPTPKHKCSMGDDIKVLQFTYIGGKCDQTKNTQDDKDECKDKNGGPSRNGSARVKCEDGNNRVLYNRVVDVGDEFEVEGRNGGDLPETLECTISDDGDDLQTLTINTGGNVDLFLKDQFGSLQLEACDDQDCTVPITYYHKITNTGETDLEVTNLDVLRPGSDSISAIGLVPDTDLSPGESTTVKEPAVLDVCVDATIMTNTDVDGVSPDGTTVTDDDDYVVSITGNTRRPTGSPTRSPTPGPSPEPTRMPTDPPSPEPTPSRPKIDVDITCSADDNGPECQQLTPPEPECDNNVDTLVFTYIGGDCDQSRNTQDDFFCEDSNGGPSNDDSATIECEDERGNEIFEENEVRVGSQVTLGDRDAYPELVQCFVKDNRGRTLQTFTVASARFEDLYLKDVFGSLQLESCDRLNCLVPVTYVYTIQNDGNTELDVTRLDRTRDDMTEDVVRLVEDERLRPDENTPAREASRIDVCVEDMIRTSVRAVGAPPSGSPVTADDSYEVTTEGIPFREIPKPCVSGKGKGGKAGKKGGDDDYYGEPKGSKLSKYSSDDDECGKGKGKGKGSDKGGKGKGKGKGGDDDDNDSGKGSNGKGKSGKKGGDSDDGKAGKGGKKGGDSDGGKGGKGGDSDDGKAGKSGKKGGESYDGKGGKGGKKGGDNYGGKSGKKRRLRA